MSLTRPMYFNAFKTLKQKKNHITKPLVFLSFFQKSLDKNNHLKMLMYCLQIVS